MIISAAEHAVERCKIRAGIEVLGAFEGLLHHLEAHDAVQGVYLGAFLVNRTIQLGTDSEHVPALFEDFEAQRREVEDVRFFRIEALMGAEEYTAFADSGDDGREVLGAFRNGLVDDTVTQFTTGIQRLAHGELREEPLFGLGVEVGLINIVAAGGAVAQDFDVEEFLNVASDTIERGIRDRCLVTIVVPRTGPLAVYLLLGNLPRTADGIHEPKVFLILYYGHSRSAIGSQLSIPLR